MAEVVDGRVVLGAPCAADPCFAFGGIRQDLRPKPKKLFVGCSGAHGGGVGGGDVHCLALFRLMLPTGYTGDLDDHVTHVKPSSSGE